MSAQKCNMHGGILAALHKHAGIKSELDRLEKAANGQIRKTLPRFRYKPGEVADVFLEDLAAVTSRDDWRSPLERSADQLRRAATHMRKAVHSTVRAANDCPTYAAIPPIVWESTPEGKAERQRIAASPAEHKLFAAVKSLRSREVRAAIDLRKIAPDFLKAMLLYAAWCAREAERLSSILEARDRRYDRLGPILKLSEDVRSFTGRSHDTIVSRLLADAFEVVGVNRQYSPDAIRKMRERHLGP